MSRVVGFIRSLQSRGFSSSAEKVILGEKLLQDGSISNRRAAPKYFQGYVREIKPRDYPAGPFGFQFTQKVMDLLLFAAIYTGFELYRKQYKQQVSVNPWPA